jgi:hypothetical protein
MLCDNRLMSLIIYDELSKLWRAASMEFRPARESLRLRNLQIYTGGIANSRGLPNATSFAFPDAESDAFPDAASDKFLPQSIKFVFRGQPVA